MSGPGHAERLPLPEPSAPPPASADLEALNPTMMSALDALAEGPLPGLAVDNIARFAAKTLREYAAHVASLTARLAAAEANRAAPDRPRVVCLCGSTRFFREFQIANYEETMAGRIVLSVGFYPHSEEHHEEIGLTNAGYPISQKEKLDLLHLRKIDLADEVLVLNVGGYIGKSTAREIAHAEATGKPIRYLEEAPHDPA